MTKQILVGGVPVGGGGAPVSVQSMTNTDTRDVETTVAQLKLDSPKRAATSCVLPFTTWPVRRRFHRSKAAFASRLADIHFDYRLAIAAMENGADSSASSPGNIGDESRVRAVVDCAKAHHTPIRIGVNAGSIEPILRQKYGGPTTED